MSSEPYSILTQLESLMTSSSVASQASAQFTSALRWCGAEPDGVEAARGQDCLLLAMRLTWPSPAASLSF